MKIANLVGLLVCSLLLLCACGGGGGGTTVPPQTVTHFTVTAPQSVSAGSSFNVAVTALTASNTVVASYSGTVTFTSTDQHAVLPNSGTLRNGSGTFSVTLKTAGSQTVTLADSASPSVTGGATLIVNPGPAAQLSVVSPSSSTTVGIPTSFSVTALDCCGNTATSYTGTVNLTSSDAQAAFQPASSLNLTGGANSGLVTFKRVGNQTITATDSITPSLKGFSSPILVSGQLVITSEVPPGGVAGAQYGSSTTQEQMCSWSPIMGWHEVCLPCPNSAACSSLPVCSFRHSPVSCRETVTEYLGFPLTAAGGLLPYSWSVEPNSSLPPGLALSAAGVLSGTPTSPGTYSVTVLVSDSGNPPSQKAATYLITISTPAPPTINPSVLLPIGTVGSPYVGFAFSAGGASPFTWSETGALPQGLTLSTSGALSGTPSVAGSFPITLIVQDAFGQSANPQSVVVQVLAQGFVPTGSMNDARAAQTATLLNTGKVLVAGGAGATADNATAELFDPSIGTFAATGSMSSERVSSTATLLPNGQVLVAGGYGGGANSLATAEIYDPSGGTFSPTGNMQTARQGQTATLLNDGKVLMAGGTDNNGNVLSSAEIFDPSAGTFTLIGNMTTIRTSHTATLLANGQVLITGGNTATAEIFDPTSATFTATGNMEVSRTLHTATLLINGQVLVTGGVSTNGLASAEIFDPPTGTFTPTGNMETMRYLHTATLLANGTVLVTGGLANVSTPLSAAELFDPAAGTFSPTADMTAVRFLHTATLLGNGQVLVTGGTNLPLASAELYK